MPNQKVIPIVSATDNNYAPYLSVTIKTILENLSKGVQVEFYIIDNDIDPDSKEKLKEVVSNHPATIEYLEADPELYEDMLESDHITQTAYFRISLPDMLEDKHYEKVLYIDCDVLVKDDVTKLYDTDIGENAVGAIVDPGQALAHPRLGIETEDFYFNSGVMVINLESWKKAYITEKTLAYLREEPQKIKYHDQDALNATLYGKWYHLHPKWNLQTSLLFERHDPPNEDYAKMYKEAIRNPSIIHFTGHDKPWNSDEYHPYADQYMEELAKTPFHGETVKSYS